jgi:hypothetical protein
LRKRLTIGVIVTALAATVSFVAAGPYYRHERAGVLPPDEIIAAVQSYGLVPTTRVFRRGPFYVLHALDRRGTELRIVADAALGDIISVTPLCLPRADAGPRIIHVPQPRDVPKPARPRRNTSGVPPPSSQKNKSADDKLSPVYPTPKYKSEIAPKAATQSASTSKAKSESDVDSRRDAEIGAGVPPADKDAKRGG